MEVIKKESYHLLRMQNERNRSVSVRGNRTVNLLIPVLRTRL